jgi:hypothetical protein
MEAVPEPPVQFSIVFGASTEAEAQLARGLLESAGVTAVVLDANLTAYQAVVAHATRGVRVAVPLLQAEQAEHLLAEAGFVRPDLMEEIPAGAQICPNRDCLRTVPRGADRCPACGEPVAWPA